ncbi:serine hydrolase [Arenimonas soli]|uniref:Serine hydrolase n=2 Tax=Arenimonas soli TaxID=2269504 RepID=A0ABQ1HFK1_9GAMM|nr:serine hydrolase [Arenimonas soli]
MRRGRLVMAMLLVANPGLAPAADEARETLAGQMPQWLAQSGTPSAGVALIRDGQVQWTLVRGEQAEGVPATKDTLYNVASLTKPVTAEVALRAASEGLAALDAPMTGHWTDPDIAADPRRDELTARLCLSHQCGFPNWRHETDDVLAIQWPPGSRPSYSGEGFEYVARYLQHAAGMPLEALAERLVFKPAGMHRTAFTGQAWFEGHVAAPRGPDGSGGEPDVRQQASAADDLHSSIGDYARFAASVVRGDGLSADVAQRRWLIDHDVSSQLCQPGRLEGDACPRRMGFAQGWVRYETKRETVFFHGGGDWGERAFVLIVPERQFGIVVLTNGAGGMAVVRDTVAALYENPAVHAFLQMQAGANP